MTEEQIERVVCSKTDRIDARYMAGKLTTEEYEAAMRELNVWADRQYRLVS